MNDNTMQLTAVAVSETAEVEETDQTRQRWHLFTPRSEKKHRIQDLVARLKRDLKRSEEINDELRETMRAHLAENEELKTQVADLTMKLRAAEKANRMNASGVDFTFAQRLIDRPEDQATMPVPQVELLSDGELKVVTTDAAVAPLDSMMSKEANAADPVVRVESTPIHGNIAENQWGLIDEDDAEVYDTTASSWRVRHPVPHAPVTWGAMTPQQHVFPAGMSTTGTFRVVPLQQRGSVNPGNIPGLSA